MDNNTQNQNYDYSNLYNNVANNQGSNPPQGQYSYTANQIPNTVYSQDYNPYQNIQDIKNNKNKKGNGTGKKIISFVLATLFFTGISIGGGYIGSTLAGNNNSSNGGTIINQTITDGSESGAVAASDSGLSISEIASIASPSVVEIMTEQAVLNPVFGQYVADGAGSGVIISEDGYIITNAHVIEGAQQIKVTLSDKTEYIAQVVGEDTMTDLAVLKIDATNLPAATLGTSGTLEVGDFAMAVGNPLGTLGGTVTDGIISALDREIYVEGQELTLLQTNAAVSPGNSGGGLFNSRGELIGIVTAKSGDIEAEGLGFAIPIDDALEITTQLMESGYVTGRPAMGITVAEIQDEQTAMQYGVPRYGVYVIGVNEGSAAAKAGLLPMDLIVSAGDIAVSTTSDLTEYIEEHEVGDTITLQIVRDDRIQTVDVVLQERAQDANEQATQDAENFFGEDSGEGNLEDFFGDENLDKFDGENE